MTLPARAIPNAIAEAAANVEASAGLTPASSACSERLTAYDSDQAGDHADGGEHRGTAEHQAQHGGRPGAEGHPDADLLGARRHDEGEQAVDAEAGEQHRHAGEGGQRRHLHGARRGLGADDLGHAPHVRAPAVPGRPGSRFADRGDHGRRRRRRCAPPGPWACRRSASRRSPVSTAGRPAARSRARGRARARRRRRRRPRVRDSAIEKCRPIGSWPGQCRRPNDSLTTATNCDGLRVGHGDVAALHASESASWRSSPGVTKRRLADSASSAAPRSRA